MRFGPGDRLAPVSPDDHAVQPQYLVALDVLTFLRPAVSAASAASGKLDVWFFPTDPPNPLRNDPQGAMERL